MLEKHTLLYASILLVVAAAGVFVLWGPNTTSKSKKKGGVVGLVNLGYKCFLNTVLQALASSSELVQWLDCHATRDDPDSLIAALSTVLHVVNGGGDSTLDHPFNPLSVMRALNVRGWVIAPGEQDAHELFLTMMMSLEEEAHKKLPKACSLVDVSTLEPLEAMRHDGCCKPKGRSCGSDEAFRRPIHMMLPFQGLLTSQLQCTTCGQKSVVSYDKFDSLTLPLPAATHGQQLSLVMLLGNLVQPELVKDVACDSCHSPSKTTAFKTLNFGKLPPCLCFHVSRTVWLENGQVSKRYDFIEFTEFLVMDSFMYSRFHAKQTSLKSLLYLNQGGDQTNSTRRASISAATSYKNVYQLMAVVVHTGNTMSGHFITYRRAGPYSNSWYYTSDSIVRKCLMEEVLSASAYMLFYSRVPKSPLASHSTSDS